MDKTTILRYFGNALLIIGYYIILWGDERLGLIIKLIAGVLLLPSFVYFKMWDSVTICGFYSFIEITRLIHLSATERL